MLLFVSPSNPTGAVYSREQVEAIGRWAAEHGLWVLTDEIYEHLVYGDAEFTSLPVVVPELRDKCIVVNGVAKTYAMTGWRVGWIDRPQGRRQGRDEPPVARHLQRLQRRAGRRPGRGLRRPDGRRRDAQAPSTAAASTIVRMLNEIDGVLCPEPEGAFYAYPSVKELLGKEIRGKRPQTSSSWPR